MFYLRSNWVFVSAPFFSFNQGQICTQGDCDGFMRKDVLIIHISKVLGLCFKPLELRLRKDVFLKQFYLFLGFGCSGLFFFFLTAWLSFFICGKWDLPSSCSVSFSLQCHLSQSLSTKKCMGFNGCGTGLAALWHGIFLNQDETLHPPHALASRFLTPGPIEKSKKRCSFVLMRWLLEST